MPRESSWRVMMARGLAVLAACLLVLTAVLASAEPYDMPMVQVLALINPAWPGQVQDTLLGMAGRAVWVDIALPILARPIWMIPAALALICAGFAFSLTPPSSKPTHRRS